MKTNGSALFCVDQYHGYSVRYASSTRRYPRLALFAGTPFALSPTSPFARPLRPFAIPAVHLFRYLAVTSSGVASIRRVGFSAKIRLYKSSP